MKNSTERAIDVEAMPAPPLRVLPHYAVPLPDGFQLRSAARTSVLRGALATRLIPHLLPLLDGTRAEDEVVQQLAPQFDAGKVRQLIHVLRERGLLEEVVAPPEQFHNGEAQDYASFARYHGGYAIPAALRQANVLVIDHGGLVTPLLGALAHCGIGQVTVLGPHSDEAVARALLTKRGVRLEANARIPTTGAEWRSQLEGRTLAVALVDRPVLFCDWLIGFNEAAVAAKVPWTNAAFLEDRAAQIGPTVVPGVTSCLSCFVAYFNQQVGLLESYPAFQRFCSAAASAPAPIVSPVHVDLVAQLLAIEIMRASSPGQDALSYGRVLTLDFETLALGAHRVVKVPRCPVCGPARDRPKMRIWS